MQKQIQLLQKEIDLDLDAIYCCFLFNFSIILLYSEDTPSLANFSNALILQHHTKTAFSTFALSGQWLRFVT